MKGVISTILLLIPLSLAYSDYVFEFGVDEGDVVYTTDGYIPLLQKHTEVDIPVADKIVITYVRVTVNAFSSPTVDYDSLLRKVSIQYSWKQISNSNYNIVVKGYTVKPTNRS